MFGKLITADSKLKANYKANYSEALATEKAKTSPFLDMNSKLWKSMTFEQRVTYFIQMRKMYLEAEKVISEKNNNNENKNKSSAFPFLDYIFKSLLPNVEAAPKNLKPVVLPQAKGKTVITKQGDRVEIPYDAKSCIVAGYLGAYTKDISNVRGDKRPGCSVDVAIATYADNADLNYVKTSNDQCLSSQGSSFVACNPMIYGTPGGHPICINKKSAQFQIATHWEGPCDSQSRLSKDHPLFDLSGKDYSKIQPREKQIEQIKKDQTAENFQLSKDFISGILASQNPQLLALFKNGDWSPELEKEIHRIGDHFKTSIDKALEICEKEITLKHESNQRGACDQLHRRYLFVDDVIARLKIPEVPVLAKVETPAEAKPEPVADPVVDPAAENLSKKNSGPNWWLLGGLALGGVALWALLNRHNSKQVYLPAAVAASPALCPPGTTGVSPNCYSTALCPPGTTGTPPNCFVAAQCPAGTTGAPPNCYFPPLCQSPQVAMNGLCGCANTCTGAAVINPISCVCSAPPPAEGGTGTNTCANPPCSGGVPTTQ